MEQFLGIAGMGRVYPFPIMNMNVFRRAGLREIMVFYDCFSWPLFSRTFSAETRLLIHFLVGLPRLRNLV